MKSYKVLLLFYLIFSSFQSMADIIVKEESLDGFFLEVHLDDNLHIQNISFSDGTSIRYQYDNERLTRIVRYDAAGNELYAHVYIWNGSKIIRQEGWFITNHVYDGDKLVANINPWIQETIDYNSLGYAIRIGEKKYSYDEKGQIIEETGFFSGAYDANCNLITINGKSFDIDERNRLIGYDYDSNGNFLGNRLAYNEINLISEANGEIYYYDSKGRLIRKGDSVFLYLGYEEIASFENGQFKTLKVPGIGGPVTIEIDSKPYATAVDASGIIRKLIDPLTHTIYRENNCDIFGYGLSDAIPYAYRGKRYDPLTGYIYFGKRFYDPIMHRWTSQDPFGSIDHENLYQYVYNNPLIYCDPVGASFWGYVLGIGEIVAGGAIMIAGLGAEVATIGGFTIGFAFAESSGLTLITDGLLRTSREVRDINLPKWDKKSFPDQFRNDAKKIPPRFNGKDLGLNPSECPGEGFEWRGKGDPESGKGNWLNPATGEKLHPDLWHPDPKGPHWGYVDPNGIPYDLFPDGTWQ